jgi:hypothetical protein
MPCSVEAPGGITEFSPMGRRPVSLSPEMFTAVVS